MKKILLTLLTVTLISSFAFATDIKAADINLSNKEFKSQITKLKTRRMLIANALLLTDVQKIKIKDLYNKNNDKEVLLFLQLKREEKVLNDLTLQKSKSADIKAQKKIVSNLQKALKTVQKENDKDFVEVLNHDQRVKYKKLKKEIDINKL